MTTNAADALERLEQKWRKQADDNEMNALEADSIGLSDAAKTSDRCAKAFTECANELANIRASLADRQGEAVAWQCRSAWGDGFTEWQECSEEDYEQMAPLLMDCRGEALATQFRALYTHPAPAAVTDATKVQAWEDAFEHCRKVYRRNKSRLWVLTCLRDQYNAALTAALQIGEKE